MRDIDIPYMSHTLSISLPSNLTVNCTSKINLTYSSVYAEAHSLVLLRWTITCTKITTTGTSRTTTDFNVPSAYILHGG